MKLCLIQMNSTPDHGENVARAAGYIDDAVAAERPDLVVVPEFFNHPYVFQYRDYAHIDEAEGEDGIAISTMRAKAREHGVYIVATIFEAESAGLCYDSAIVIDPSGAILGRYRKAHPAAVRSLEKIYFRYGSHFPIFRIGEWRVGINICYDTFFPESARCAALNGAELIVVPFAAPGIPCWRETMQTRAFENGVYFAPCNKVGLEGEWIFGGRSMIVAPDSAGASRGRRRGRRDDLCNARPRPRVRGPARLAHVPRPPARPLHPHHDGDGRHPAHRLTE